MYAAQQLRIRCDGTIECSCPRTDAEAINRLGYLPVTSSICLLSRSGMKKSSVISCVALEDFFISRRTFEVRQLL